MTTPNTPIDIINQINQIFKIELKFKDSYNNYNNYEAEIINPLPCLFKEIKISLAWNTQTESGQVSYDYSHPSGGSNGYTIGFIKSGKFEHIRN